jgi:hypothetical protein
MVLWIRENQIQKIGLMTQLRNGLSSARVGKKVNGVPTYKERDHKRNSQVW